MPQLRTEPITKLPLSAVGERLSIDHVERRVAAHLKNLRVDAPVLNFLWSSFVSWELEVADRILWVVFSLQEVMQSQLDLIGHMTRTKTEDPFLDDVSDARRQVSEVKWRTLMALSAAASSLDGTHDSAEAASTSSVRQRVKRSVKGGKLVLAGWPEPAQLEFDDLPTVLPQVIEVEISAKVVWLDHESAGLSKVAVERQPASGPAVEVDGQKEVLLGRVGHFARAEHGTRLQVVMDTGKRVHLQVMAQLDWATAAVVVFELRDFAGVDTKAADE
jgi:hypothetical protein